MALLVLVIGGVSIFCFTQGYIAAGVICLVGFSKQFGWPALIATSIYLFTKEHWIAGALPLLLIAWNLVGLKMLKKSREDTRPK